MVYALVHRLMHAGKCGKNLVLVKEGEHLRPAQVGGFSAAVATRSKRTKTVASWPQKV